MNLEQKNIQNTIELLERISRAAKDMYRLTDKLQSVITSCKVNTDRVSAIRNGIKDHNKFTVSSNNVLMDA